MFCQKCYSVLSEGSSICPVCSYSKNPIRPKRDLPIIETTAIKVSAERAKPITEPFSEKIKSKVKDKIKKKIDSILFN